MKRNILKGLSAVLTAAIVFTGAGFTLTKTEAHAAVTFTDISNSYWAKDDIAFAADKGIVNGYASFDGTYTFLPENQVSYEEAATMLYRALKAAGQLEAEALDATAQSAGQQGAQNTAGTTDGAVQTSGAAVQATSKLVEKHKDALDAANIADWAREYVAYGLEYGIIEQSELAFFVDANTKLGNPAPRQTVAVWTAKALDKDFAGAYYLPYTDSSQIDDVSAPYIDVLYRHGIMQGSLQTDGTIAFMPNSGVKRSEFAAISNRVFNNAGLGYDIEKETFEYKITDGQLAGGGEIRIADDAKVYGGTFESSTAVAGMTFKDGERAEVHYVNTPEVQKGKIVSTEDLPGDVVKVTIDIGEEISYLFDTNTVNTAKIKKGTNVSFIADGIHLIEVK